MGAAVMVRRGVTGVRRAGGCAGAGRRSRRGLVAIWPPVGQIWKHERAETLPFIVAGGVIRGIKMHVISPGGALARQ